MAQKRGVQSKESRRVRARKEPTVSVAQEVDATHSESSENEYDVGESGSELTLESDFDDNQEELSGEESEGSISSAAVSSDADEGNAGSGGGSVSLDPQLLSQFQERLSAVLRVLGLDAPSAETNDRKSVPWKRKGPDMKALASLGQQEQTAVAREMAGLSARAMKLALQGLGASSAAIAPVDIPENVVGEILKESEQHHMFPVVRQYAMTGLWRRISRVNKAAARTCERACTDEAWAGDGDGGAHPAPSRTMHNGKGARRENGGQPYNVDNMKALDAYKCLFTQDFGNDLDYLRQDGEFDERKVSLLIDCMESGLDIFSPLETSLLRQET
eukprot:Rmarinus@m.24780